MPDKPSFWAVLPANVRYDENLTASAKLLYAEISALCDRYGYCYASNRYFAELYAVSLKTVQRLIKTLGEYGYIRVEVERKPGTGEVVERRIYAGIIPEPNGIPPHLKNDMTSPQGDVPSYQNCGDGSPQKCGIEQSNKDINNTPLYPPDREDTKKRTKRDKSVPKWKPERFVKFWGYYAKNVRGEDRTRAVRAWDKLRPDDGLIDQMGQALLRQLNSDEWRRGIGLPYASTWLNNRRWEDAPPPERTGNMAEDDIVRESGYLPTW